MAVSLSLEEGISTRANEQTCAGYHSIVLYRYISTVRKVDSSTGASVCDIVISETEAETEEPESVS